MAEREIAEQHVAPHIDEQDMAAAGMEELIGEDVEAHADVPPATPDVHRPAQLIRIAAMVRELLGEVRQSSPDDAGRQRLREVYERALAELREGLSEGLQQELDTLTLPLAGTPSESEIRLAQAQLVGWLEGLFQGIQAAVWVQHVQAQAQFEEMRRRGLPVGLVVGADDARRGPGQYL